MTKLVARIPLRPPRLLLVAVLLLAACRSPGGPEAHLERLYQPLVQAQDRNPVLVIPGFMGSRLALEDKTVWGAFTGETVQYKSPEGLRTVVPDLWEAPEEFGPADVPRLGDDVVATGPLERIRFGAIFAVFSVDIYASLLRTLGIGGYVDEAYAPLDYGPEHFNCYTFHYDWRLDVVANARALGAYIDRIRPRVAERRRQLGLPERPVRFDVVAHSMGGLIARYYLRYGTEDVLDERRTRVPWAGAGDIDRLILVAPPNRGSVEALDRLTSGWKKNLLLPRFPSTMIAALPSVYQLLPRPRDDLFLDAEGNPRSVAFLSVETWLDNDWGPFAPQEDARLRLLFPELAGREARRRRMAVFVGAFLERARRLAAALDRVPPARPRTEIYLFAGDTVPTPARGQLVEEEGVTRLRFPDGPAFTDFGDGRVTRVSALASPPLARRDSHWLSSPVPWTASLFIDQDHLGLTRDATFQDNLLHILLERRPASFATAR